MVELEKEMEILSKEEMSTCKGGRDYIPTISGYVAGFSNIGGGFSTGIYIPPHYSGSTDFLGGSGTDEDPYLLSEVVVYGKITGGTPPEGQVSFVDAMGAFCFGNGAKAELIQQLKRTGELGTGVSRYLNVAKGIGYVGAITEGVTSAYNIYENFDDAISGNVEARKQIAWEIADIGFTALGTFGGPIGLGLAGVYYIYRVNSEH